MPPLTWQNVAAPDFRGVTEALTLSGRSLDAGFGGAADAIGKFGDARKENALADILRQTQGMTDPGQIRNALAGMDTSGLGSGQFLQFDKMLGARGEEATRQQAFDQLNITNPIVAGKLREELNNAILTNPLNRTNIVAETNSRNASAALSSANAASVREATDFNNRTAGVRFDKLDTEQKQRLGVYLDIVAARTGRDNATNYTNQVGEGPDAYYDALGLYHAAQGSMSPAERTFALAELRNRYGLNQSTFPYAPVDTDAGRGGPPSAARSSTGASAPAPPPNTLTAASIKPADGQEREVDGVVQLAKAATRAIDIAVGEQIQSENNAGPNFSLTEANRTPQSKVVNDLTVKGAPYAAVGSERLNNVVRSIMNEGTLAGVTINASTAMAMLESSYNFSNRLFADTGFFAASLEGAPLRIDDARITALIQSYKTEGYKDRTIAAKGISTALREATDARDDYIKSQRALQDGLRYAQTNNQGDSPTVRRLTAEAAASESRLNKALTRVTAVGSPQALVDTPGTLRFTAPDAAPDAAAAAAAALAAEQRTAGSSTPPPQAPIEKARARRAAASQRAADEAEKRRISAETQRKNVILDNIAADLITQAGYKYPSKAAFDLAIRATSIDPVILEKRLRELVPTTR